MIKVPDCCFKTDLKKCEPILYDWLVLLPEDVSTRIEEIYNTRMLNPTSNMQFPSIFTSSTREHWTTHLLHHRAAVGWLGSAYVCFSPRQHAETEQWRSGPSCLIQVKQTLWWPAVVVCRTVAVVISAGCSSLWKQISGPNHSLSHEGIWSADLLLSSNHSRLANHFTHSVGLTSGCISPIFMDSKS